MAANRIIEGFTCILGKTSVEVGSIPIVQVQSMAKQLFEESSRMI